MLPETSVASPVELNFDMGQGEMPATFTARFDYQGEACVVEMSQRKVVSDDFRMIRYTAEGAVEQIPCSPQTHTYVGAVVGDPESVVTAWLCQRGLFARVRCAAGEFEILPPGDVTQPHAVVERRAVDAALIERELPVPAEFGPEPVLELAPAKLSGSSQEAATVAAVTSNSFALPQRAEVRRAKIGFDVSNRTFRQAFQGDQNASTFPNGNFGTGFSNNPELVNRWLQAFINDRNVRYIRDNLVFMEIVTVVIRDDRATDPYDAPEFQITSNTLRRMIDIWNGANSQFPRPPGDPDLVHGMIGNSGGGAVGLAFVGRVNERLFGSIGSTSSGSGLNFWRGVGEHEILHTWGGVHEVPRGIDLNEAGVDVSAGMIPGDRRKHNVDEHRRVISERNSSNLPAFTEFDRSVDNSTPYGELDEIDVSSDGSTVLLDVLANDHDANNDPFELESFILFRSGNLDSVRDATETRLGAQISISEGTGPGGRDQIAYTPPFGASGLDSFLYVMRDDTGRGSFGTVRVRLAGSQPGVTLYRATNQGSGSVTLPVGTHRQGFLNTTEVPVGEASSVLVPLNYSVRLYSSDSLRLDDGFLDLEFGIHNLTDFRMRNRAGEDLGSANDNVSAVRVNFVGVSRPLVEVFRDANFGGIPGEFSGEEEGITNGVYRRSRLDINGVGHDQASSVRVPPGYTVTLHDNDPPGGDNLTLTASAASLGALNDRTTSLVVTYEDPGSQAFVYTGVDFIGRQGWFLAGSYNATALEAIGLPPGGIQSLQVPDGLSVQLFTTDDFTGDSVTVEENVADLSTLDLSGPVRSLIVVGSSVDTDGDGLPDDVELEFYGDPTANTDGTDDIDGDGLPDAYEFVNFGDIRANADENTDRDEDGLPDARELAIGTNPALVDTDGDLVADPFELRWRSDPTDPNSVPVVPDLVAYYNFDEGSGSTAFDIARSNGAQNAATSAGAIDWTDDGRIGGALDLDGESSLFAANAIPANATGFTISAWVRPRSFSTFTGVFVGRDNPGNWGINLQNGFADLRVVGTGGGSSGLDTPAGSIVLNEWQHLALTWSADGTGQGYLNGQPFGSVATNLTTAYTAPTEGYTVGNDTCCGGRFLNGQVDELAIFATELDASAIGQLFSAGQNGQSIFQTFDPPALDPQLFQATLSEIDGGVSVQWTSPAANLSYRILRTTDLTLPLTAWAVVESGTSGVGEVISVDESFSPSMPRAFYVIEFSEVP